MSDVSWIPRIGDEFAGYRLVSLLGHGGMSIVYRAEHIALERTVALKLLSPQLSDDEDFRERFQRESKVAASLEHPNIIPIYEAGGENGVFYIAMRYVDGADLKTRLKESGQLEAQQVVSFVAQVAAALEAAHARGLIHRDVKPANILIAPGAGVEGSDHVYLSDFGVAKNTAAAGLTKTGLFVGTAEYASPEQIEGKELDGRADIYSLGCVAYEALTGAPTYEKDSEVAMMYAHLLEPPPKLSERRPDLGFAVDEVIAKAVAKSRDDRYARPSEFALALRQAVGANAPVGPETILAGSALAAPAAPAAPAEKPAEPAPRQTEPEPTPQPPAEAAAGASNRRKLVVGGGILAVIVAAGVLIPLLALSGGKSSSPPDGCGHVDRRHHGRHADRRARGVEPAVSPGAVAGREGVHSAKRAGQRGSGDLRLRVGADRSDIRAQRVPILVLSQGTGPPPRIRAGVHPGSRRRQHAGQMRIRPGGRTCLDPPDREAGRSVLLPPGCEGELRHRLDPREAREHRITWTCSAPRPSPAARRRSSAAGGIRSTTRSASAVRRSARSFASTAIARITGTP